MLLKNIGLGEITKNSLLLVEEELGVTKSLFLQSLVLDSLKNGLKVMYIYTSGSAEDLFEEIKLMKSGAGDETKNLTILEDVKNRESLIEICNSLSAENNTRPVNICVVDTFSYLYMEESMHDLINDLKLLQKTSRKGDIRLYLASDTGVLKEREERILRSMIDGIIQFRTEYQTGKINRFISIPKMRGIQPLERLIPYRIKEGVITPDVRERVG